MAKVVVFSNVFDTREKEAYEAKSGETIEQFLCRTSLADKTFSSMCEVYDPETGETSYCAIEDNPGESLKINACVNGLQKTPDYVIQESDLVTIQIFPANSAGRVAEAILGGALVVGGILLAWFTAGSSLAGTWAGLGVLGIGMGAGALGAWLVYDALRDPKDKDKKSRELANDKQPTISGAQNQLLEGPFPLLVGRITATPYVIGSLYNDFVIDNNDHATYFGTRQKATLLLAIAYAPVYIEDIKFDSLIVAKNKNHVLSGPLYHNYIEENGAKYAENPWNPGHAITFNGKKSEYEVEAMWNSNKIKFEISQFGNHRTLYPITVKQSKVDEAVLYCYDNEYREVADEHTITWQGGQFPTGMRTNTIRASEPVPWKVAVGIELPSGLFRQHSTEEGHTIYTKIPMNLVIQWRPLYKYVSENDLDTLGDGEDVYKMTAAEEAADTYDKKRFYGWRNFTDVQVSDGPVSIIDYTSTKQTVYHNYWYYEGNERKASKAGDSYGYYRSLEPDSSSGTFVAVSKAMTTSQRTAALESQYTYKFLTKTLDASEVEALRNYSDKSGSSAYDYYMEGNPILKNNIIKAKQGEFTYGNAVYGVSGNSQSTSSIYGQSTPSTASGVYSGSSANKNTTSITYEEYSLYILNNELPSACRDAIRDLSEASAASFDNDAYWIQNNENTSTPGVTETVSERECALNLGLSAGTSTDCNPTWNGAKVFSFGAASCGRRIWDEVNKKDPSIERSDITFSDDTYTSELSFAESPMKFEISASLSKEDILDLLNSNPKTKNTSYTDKTLANLTDVEINGIQVRVIRLTPCYINKSDGSKSYKYNDVVKWTYLKTYCIDKQKLLDDIQNLTETAQIIDPGTGQTKTVAYSKIDCSPETYNNPAVHPDGGTWLDWNIEDYYSRPISTEDSLKLALLAVECEPDILGRISSSIDKINLTGYAITPALLHDWTRYWYVVNGEYYRCDYYDSSDTRDLSLHPMWGPDDYMWTKSTYEEFNHQGVMLITGESYDGQYWYEEMNKDWQAEFFPNKVEPKQVLQLETDDNGAPIYNDKGVALTETVRQGNDWIPYIANYMSEHQDSAGRWIATEAFRNAFLNQNAIAQVLGFMCGQSLGKDAYWYSSLNHKRFVRYWYADDDGEDNVSYYCRDTEDTEFNSDRVIVFDKNQQNNAYLWTLTTKEDWNGADRTELGNGYSWSMRKPGSSFNMLALKEAYEYTDAIDIGGSFGPLSYKCNMYVTNQQKVVDLMNTILACARAFWFYDEMGRLEYHNDKPRKYPVLTISDENVISSTFSRTFAKGIAGYHGTFQDENNDFQEGEIYVLREGQSREAHTRDILDTSITGVTNPKQMWAMLAYMLGTMITRREAWEVSLNHVGNGLTIGSMIEMQSSTLEIGTDTSGRIARLIEDDDYIYGFITDRTYEYRAEYNEDGSNIQGCTLLQPTAKVHSRKVTARFASRNQQQTGIAIGGNTFANLVGQTNLCLLEKKISKNQERQVGQEADEDTGTMLYTQFIPAAGDIVMFGNIGSITQKAIVYELQYDEKGKVSASLYPYFDSLYKAGDSLPAYSTSMTKRARNDSVPVSMEVTRTELDQESVRLQTNSNAAVTGIIEGGGKGIEAPDAVTAVSAIARRDQIDVTWTFSGTGLSNSIDKFVIVITKGDGTEVIGYSAGTSYSYMFVRKDALGHVVDGYPEHGDLEGWTVTVTPVNVYGLAGETSDDVYVNASAQYYGTWQFGQAVPDVKIQQNNSTGRVLQATFTMPARSDLRQLYGTIKYRVQIQRRLESGYIPAGDEDYDDPTEWWAPATSANPYEGENNYKDESADPDYIVAQETYLQTLPLAGQSYVGEGKTQNTPYRIRVCAENEAETSGWSYPDPFTATVTGIYDLVKANETSKSAYITELSSICANLGRITGGSMNGGEFNYWTLETLVNAHPDTDPDKPVLNKDYQGAFQVGGVNTATGEEQFLRVVPQINIDGHTIDGYEIVFKVGKFEISSQASKLNGEFIVQTNETSLNRTRITPIGTFFESRTTPESTDWEVVAKQDTGGILSEQVYSNGTLLLSNAGIEARRNEGLDIGNPYLSSASRVYHFDTDEVDATRQLTGDVLDQNGQTGLTVSVASGGHAKEVGSEQGDQYRPAIQVKAPYSEIGNSLAGQFSLVHSLGSGTKWTVDFWFQYTWAEGQEMFRVDTDRATVSVKTEVAEPNYNYLEEGVPPYNTESMDSGVGVLPYNVARPDVCNLIFEKNGKQIIHLDDIGIHITPDDWVHCAVTLDSGTLTVMLSNDSVVTRYQADPEHEVPYVLKTFGGAGKGGTFTYNSTKGTALIDELLVDASIAETAAAFGTSSVNKIPWGALAAGAKRYMMVMDEGAEFISNINFANNLILTDADFEEIFDV